MNSMMIVTTSSGDARYEIPRTAFEKRRRVLKGRFQNPSDHALDLFANTALASLIHQLAGYGGMVRRWMNPERIAIERESERIPDWAIVERAGDLASVIVGSMDPLLLREAARQDLEGAVSELARYGGIVGWQGSLLV
ncbi:MAG: hypothetical protein HY459_02130 [Parcubacteria group bacterium]|nr:hypothetical protein [Parcubacteria group bacterium]